MPFEISKSERGGDVLRYEGHDYVIKRKNADGSVSWRCRMVNKFRCRSTITTNGEHVRIPPTVHSHDGDPVRSEVKAAQAVMRNAASSSHSTTRTVVAGGLRGLGADAMQRMPQKSSLEDMVRRKRAKICAVAPMPATRNFDIPGEYTDLILFDSGRDDEERIIAIGKWDLVECLSGGEWFCDGTFQLVPEIFFQLYTIHARVGNNYPPCVYFLLPSKTGAIYRKMLEALKRFLLPHGFCPRKILLDFEMAAMNAFVAEFPQAQISGCFFHLSQSVIRKVGDLGLKRQFDLDKDFQILVKSLPALSFVPLNEVFERFQELGRLFPQGNEDEHVDAIDQLLLYFEHTYIRGREIRLGEHREAKFPPRLWNHFQDAEMSAPKTTNCCEGFHAALKSLIQSPKPTIWKFLDHMRNDMAIQSLVLANAQVQNPQAKRPKYVQLASRLSEKVRGYDNEQDKMRFLRAIVNLQMPV